MSAFNKKICECKVHYNLGKIVYKNEIFRKENE